MKTIALLGCSLILVSTVAAEGPVKKIDGFMDVPWGATEDAVKKNFPSRSHARLDQVKSGPGKLWFIGGKLAKFKMHSFNLVFVGDHFWSALAVFEAQSKDHAKEYAEIRQQLVAKYGPPESEEVQGPDHIANWYVGEGPQERDRIELHTDTAGQGLRIMYASDALRKSLAQPVAGAPATPASAAKAKPLVPAAPAAPGAKDDL
jgi:hypothetical protein